MNVDKKVIFSFKYKFFCVERLIFSMSGEERADYMMDAFLDEQNTLIRPLVTRKLHLVKLLDERAGIVEKFLDEKRRKFAQNKRSHDLIAEIEALEEDLEQLSEEKVNVLQQLMDLVKRPYDTILEVEAVLENAARDVEEEPTTTTVQVKTTRAAAAPSSTQAPVATSTISPPEEELWCFCRRPDDGRQMVACDNAKCDLVWWHLDCIEKYILANRVGTSPPHEDGESATADGDSTKTWHCPVCIAQEIVGRETAGDKNHNRRRRR
jgi:hypothetical protein